MSKKYRVTGIERLKFSMEIEAESKAEAKRKFDAYARDGAYGWDSAGVTTRVEEIKEGGANWEAK